MKIIVGLGNPGKEYESTRHNAGFLCLDYLREKWGFSRWKEEKKFKAEIAEGNQFGTKCMLCKPQTYMNLSGEAVQALCSYYKCETEDIIVIYDEKELQFGSIKIRPNGGTARHKGLHSIVERLGTNTIARVRIGIECRNEDSPIDTKDFVLSKFKEEEKGTLSAILERIENALSISHREGIAKAMEYINAEISD